MKRILFCFLLMLFQLINFAQGTPESLDWSWMSYSLDQQINLKDFVVKKKSGLIQTITPKSDRRYTLEIDESNSVNSITYHFDDGTDMFEVQMKVMQELGDFHQESNEGDFLIETYRFRKGNDTFGLNELEITFISNDEEDTFLLVLAQRTLIFSQ